MGQLSCTFSLCLYFDIRMLKTKILLKLIKNMKRSKKTNDVHIGLIVVEVRKLWAEV